MDIMDNSKQIHQLDHETNIFNDDDFIAIDGSAKATRKMSSKNLINLTSQSALAGNIAKAFDPTKTYSPGNIVAYYGKLYKFKNPHSGEWNPADAELYTLDEETATNPITDQYIENLFSEI